PLRSSRDRRELLIHWKVIIRRVVLLFHRDYFERHSKDCLAWRSRFQVCFWQTLSGCGVAGSDQARSSWCFLSPAFLFGGTATTSCHAFWLALLCSECFTMSSTSRWFGSTIVNGLRQTARLVGLGASCSGAVARWLEFTSA